MSSRSKINLLPETVKKSLNNKLLNNAFSDYQGLSEWLKSESFEIGKSQVHRYGQKLERKLSAVQASTQAAMMIADATPDDGDARSQALLSMIQTELFNSLIELQSANDEDVDPEKRITMLAKAGKGIADIVKASVLQKQHAIGVREKAKSVADEVEDLSKTGGLSDETANLIRAKILGIAE